MKAYIILLVIFSAIMLSSCVITQSQGVYDGSECQGWRRERVDGAAYRYFREPSNRASGSVVFKTITKNRIHIIVLSGTANKPAFNEPRFKVILHATPGDIEYYFDAKEDSIVEIPDAESFDITVPSFQDGNGQTPTLIVHFRWSDRRVWNTNKIALIGTKTAKQQNGVGFGVLG